MALINTATYRGSLFNIIYDECEVEMNVDELYIIRPETKIANICNELGFTSPRIDVSQFCKMWEANTRAIWFALYGSKEYLGPTKEQMYRDFYIKYLRRFEKENYNG